jgi:hypothetical protein
LTTSPATLVALRFPSVAYGQMARPGETFNDDHAKDAGNAPQPAKRSDKNISDRYCRCIHSKLECGLNFVIVSVLCIAA